MLDLETRIEYVETLEDIVQMKPKDVEEEDAALFLAKMFSKACKDYFEAIKIENKIQMFSCPKTFREYSCFFKKEDVVIYVHISDYLFWGFKNVMYKIAKHSQDFSGDNCRYCDIIDIEESIMKLFEEELEKKERVTDD